jgi:hypothetical protein
VSYTETKVQNRKSSDIMLNIGPLVENSSVILHRPGHRGVSSDHRMILGGGRSSQEFDEHPSLLKISPHQKKNNKQQVEENYKMYSLVQLSKMESGRGAISLEPAEGENDVGSSTYCYPINNLRPSQQES